MANIKKPSKVSGSKKRPRPTRFYALVFSVILVFGLFNGFLVKMAFADNNYIDNIKFYNDADYGNKATLQFHVKTTFSISNLPAQWDTGQFCDTGGGTYYPNQPILKLNGSATSLNNYSVRLNGSFVPFTGWQQCSNLTFTAGYTYDLFLSADVRYANSGNTFIGYYRNDYSSGNSYYTNLTTANYISDIFCSCSSPNACDNGVYHLVEYPVLAITFPQANAQMTGAFYIDGTYSVPSISDYPKLIIWFTTPENITYPNAYKELTTTTGTLHEKITNLPAGNYSISFIFSGNLTYEFPLQIPVQIVNDIPPELPTGETPPTIPIYPPTAPDTYHADYCAYGTSTTPLFNTLTGAVSGMITNIGQSLADFAGKFSLTDAKSTGEQLASSVLIMRSYVAGLNSFFGELPVGEILVLYLIVFVLVILFRVIKGLINLIKP